MKIKTITYKKYGDVSPEYVTKLLKEYNIFWYYKTPAILICIHKDFYKGIK